LGDVADAFGARDDLVELGAVQRLDELDEAAMSAALLELSSGDIVS